MNDPKPPRCPVHHTRGNKRHHAGCPTCKTWSAWSRRDLLRRRRSEGPLTVDPARTIAHIAELRAAGMALRAIAERSGLTHRHLLDVIRGDIASLWAETEAAVLGVTLADMPPARSIDGTGVRRRIQGLAVAGHSNETIAGWLGVTFPRVSQLAYARQVTPGLADRVRLVADRHALTPGQSARAALMARKKGWAPLLAWDEDTIDDPTARPTIGDRHARDDQVDEAAVERIIAGTRPAQIRQVDQREAIRRLWRDGATDEAIADRLCVEPSAVTRLRQRHGYTMQAA